MKTSIIFRLYYKEHSKAAEFSLLGTCVTRRAAENIIKEQREERRWAADRFKIVEVPAFRVCNSLLAADDLQLIQA